MSITPGRDSGRLLLTNSLLMFSATAVQNLTAQTAKKPLLRYNYTAWQFTAIRWATELGGCDTGFDNPRAVNAQPPDERVHDVC